MTLSEYQKTNNKKLKTAVIGVGSLGQHHARNFAEVAAKGGGKFVGVSEDDQFKTDRFDTNSRL